MDQVTREQIEQIIGEMQCPKAFRCTESGFAAMCKAQDIDLKDYLVCLEDNPGTCTFSISFGDAYFCKCPLRIYIAKNLRVEATNEISTDA